MYTPQATGSAPKIQFFVFCDLIMTKLHDSPYLVNHRSYKVGWLLKMDPKIDLLWIFCDVYAPLTTGNFPKCLFSFSYDEILKVSISRELYIILNWPTLQNDPKIHHSISVYHNIYIKNQRRISENSLKWEFQA